uniref:peptidylprolyl isomerase n=1 Tax=Macrostomum lignano TaxID=282301 RepID=A0A1I8ISQ8_9PLAT
MIIAGGAFHNLMTCSANATAEDIVAAANSSQHGFTTSVSAEYGLCDSQASLGELSGVFLLAGCIPGSLMAGPVTDSIGRIPGLLIGLLCTLATNLLAALAPQFWLHLASRLVCGFFASWTMGSVFVYGNEVLMTKHRGRYVKSYNLGTAQGGVLLALLAFALRDYKWLMIANSFFVIPPVIAIAFLPESPSWLLSQRTKSVKKVKRALQKIAWINRRSLPESVLSLSSGGQGEESLQLEENGELLDTQQAKDHGTPRAMLGGSLCTSIKKLLSDRVVVFRLLSTCLYSFSSGFAFYGFTFVITHAVPNIYITFALMAAVETPALPLLNIFSRGRTLFFSGVAIFCCCVAIIIVFVTVHSEDEQLSTGVIVLLVFLAVSGKFFSNIAFCAITAVGAEIYPTAVRNTGLGLLMATLRTGCMLSPLVNFIPYIPARFATIGLACFVAAFPTRSLPDTRIQDLTETVDDERKMVSAALVELSLNRLTLVLLLPLLCRAGYVEITTLSKPDACQDQVRQNDRVAVHYTGKFASGQVFDSSYSRGEPIEFVLGKRHVIPGWEQGLLGIEIRKLVIPPELAYGKQGHPPVIPPDSTLVFETKLVSIKRDSGGRFDLSGASLHSLASLIAVPAFILYAVYYVAKRYKEQEAEQKKAKQLRKKRPGHLLHRSAPRHDEEACSLSGAQPLDSKSVLPESAGAGKSAFCSWKRQKQFGKMSNLTGANASEGKWHCGVSIENHLERLSEISQTGDNVIVAVYLLVTSAGLLGNSLILLVSIRARQYRRSAVHTYVTHLAAADLFFLAICAPVHTIVFFWASAWPLGDPMCKLLHFLQPLAMHASAAFLTAMAVDRCLSVSGLGSAAGRGVAGSMRGSQRAAAAPRYAGALWAGAVLVALPWPLVYRVKNGVCTYELSEQYGPLKIGLFAGRATLGYAVPFVIIAFCSVRMLRRLWRFGRHRGAANSRRVIALVVALVFSFFICWLPLHVADIVTAFFVCRVFFLPDVSAANLMALNRFNQLTILLSYCNACANPAIYSCLSESFRRGLYQILARTGRARANRARRPV